MFKRAMAGIRWTLRRKLLAVLLLLVIFSLGVGAYHAYQAFERKRLEAEAELLDRARETALNIDRFIAATGQILLSLSEVPAVKRMDRIEAEALLARLLPQYPFFENLITVGADGWIVASVVRPEGRPPVNVSDRPYFREVMATGRFTVGGAQIGRLTGKPVFVVAQPVRDFSGRQVGMVGAPISLLRFRDLLVEPGQPQEVMRTVVDGMGRVLACSHDPAHWVAQDLGETPWFRQIAAQNEGALEIAFADGVPRLAGVAPALAGAVSVVASRPKEEMFAPLRKDLFERFLLLTALFLGVVLLVEVAIRHFTKPLTRLAEGARRIGAGDLEARIPVAGEDEVGVVAEAFNDG